MTRYEKMAHREAAVTLRYQRTRQIRNLMTAGITAGALALAVAVWILAH